MNTAMINASTLATLVAADALGASWSGAPNTAGVLGTAAGTLTLAGFMARRGRRAGLLLAYGLAILGALFAMAAVVGGSLILLMVALLLLGFGNGGAQLARYAAAELYPPERRGFGLSAVVWAGTIGAVVGPAVITPAAAAGSALGLPPFAGVFVFVTLVVTGATIVTTLLPSAKARNSEPHPGIGGLSHTFRSLRLPQVKIALAAMVVAQLIMVAVMTMAPLHLHMHGENLRRLGFVLSAHTLGMFVLSPLSGWFTDRFGGTRVIWGSLATLAIAALSVVFAPDPSGHVLTAALFLLGYGWNLAIVGGSALLSVDIHGSEGTRLQGLIDSLVWSSSAIATLASGAIFAAGGYLLLASVSGTLVLIPAVLLLRFRAAFPSRLTHPRRAMDGSNGDDRRRALRCPRPPPELRGTR
jgi:MFS family permease